MCPDRTVTVQLWALLHLKAVCKACLSRVPAQLYCIPRAGTTRKTLQVLQVTQSVARRHQQLQWVSAQ